MRKQNEKRNQLSNAGWANIFYTRTLHFTIRTETVSNLNNILIFTAVLTKIPAGRIIHSGDPHAARGPYSLSTSGVAGRVRLGSRKTFTFTPSAYKALPINRCAGGKLLYDMI